MAIKHLKYLQSHHSAASGTGSSGSGSSSGSSNGYGDESNSNSRLRSILLSDEERDRQFRAGYQECVSDVVRYLVDYEGMLTGYGVCNRLMNHLSKCQETVSTQGTNVATGNQHQSHLHH